MVERIQRVVVNEKWGLFTWDCNVVVCFVKGGGGAGVNGCDTSVC